MASAAFAESFIVNNRGQKLRCLRYLPAGSVRGVLRHHHGLGDHAVRNEEFFQHLTAAGFAVFTFDAHGHGKSEPLDEPHRVAIRTFAHVVEDSCLHVDTVVRPYIDASCPGAPLFLSGSSMGAAATILTAAHPSMRDVKGVVLNATAADASRTFVQRLQEPLAAVANRLCPLLQIVPAAREDKFIRNPEELVKRRADPLLYAGGLKVCSACSMLEAFKLIREQAGQVAQPILAIHGAKDQVCPLPFTQRFLDSCSSQDKTLTVYPDALHDTLHDYEKLEIFDAVLAWLQARCA